MGEPIQSFTELHVYRMACDLDYQIFVETKGWPHEEKYSLVDQIRRSSRSVGASLAESWLRPVGRMPCSVFMESRAR
jgi:four helix bundle protein